MYSVPASGGKATPITPGTFEVEYVNITPDRSRMIYNSNQDDIDRRHIWSGAGRRGVEARSKCAEAHRQRMAAGGDELTATSRRCTPTGRCRRM